MSLPHSLSRGALQKVGTDTATVYLLPPEQLQNLGCVVTTLRPQLQNPFTLP